MKKIEHSELEQVLMVAYERKVSPIILGRTGIGKSRVIKDTAKKIAASKKKKFVEWNELNLKQKRDLIKTPEKYFCFLDIRLTQSEPSDIKGLPAFEDDAVVWKKNLWVEAFRKVDGVILFDEINLSPPMLQNSVYQIILDKQVGESPLNKDILVVGAGNLTQDKANTFEIPKPIISRGMVFELQPPSGDAWVGWALDNHVENRVISYLKFASHKLFFEKDDMLNIITPRGWEFVSNLIRDKTDINEIELLSSGILGEGGGYEFAGFIKLTNKWDINKILANPKKAELPSEVDQLYSLVSAIADKYASNKKLLPNILQLSERLKPDFAFLLMRFIKRTDPTYFINTVITLKEWEKVRDKYGKYVA